MYTEFSLAVWNALLKDTRYRLLTMKIIIDTKGDTNLANRNQLYSCVDDDKETKSIDHSLRIYDIDYLCVEKEEPKKPRYVPNKDVNLEEFEADMGWKSSEIAEHTKELARVREEVNPLDRILEKSVITSGFEKLRFVPPYELNNRQLKMRKQREERKAGAGAEWFNMRSPYVTPEVKHDLEVLRMRSALNPKHFYKKNDMKALPKYFQVGRIIDSPVDYYSARLTKKERKKTIVDELMADAEFTKYNKRKYKEIIEEKQKSHYKAHKHARRLKGKRK